VPHICWPGLAHRELSDQLAANQAAERALTLAEPDPLVLSFAMTGSRELLEALPRHQTAHAALLADILAAGTPEDVAPRPA
jgi:LuxR family transcriptional regulator, maltose regulon positive regulatory protein